MNYGNFKKSSYTKKVSFSKAILWHTRQISLRKDIMDQILLRDLKFIVFFDYGKMESLVFKVENVYLKMELKQVGQEEQYYFPIDIANKKKIKPAKVKEKEVKLKPTFTYDPVRNIYIKEN